MTEEKKQDHPLTIDGVERVRDELRNHFEDISKLLHNSCYVTIVLRDPEGKIFAVSNDKTEDLIDGMKTLVYQGKVKETGEENDGK